MASVVAPEAFEFQELVDAPSPISTGTTINSLAQAAIDKLARIQVDLKAFYVGASHAQVLQDMILAVAIGEHLLMLGDPGLGKSAMSRDLFGRIRSSVTQAVNFFEILMSKATDPSELAGPIDMEAYKKGTFRRQTAGMMPEAYCAFIDEIYKSNSVALNFLLASLNERKFHNGGKAIDIPLRFVIAASNEGPESDELSALHDRILFRHIITESDDGDQFVQMLENIEARENGTWTWPHNESITTDELDALTDFIKTVRINAGIFAAFKEVREKLKNQGVRISPRRWGKCLRIVKGNAALSGRAVASRSDFRCLIHVLAETETDKQQIRVLIEEMAQGPWLSKLVTYHEDAQKDRDNFLDMPDATEDQQKSKSRAGMAIKTKLVKLVKAVSVTMKEAQANGEDMEELKAIQRQIIAVNHDVVKYLHSKIGVVNPIESSEDTDLGF